MKPGQPGDPAPRRGPFGWMLLFVGVALLELGAPQGVASWAANSHSTALPPMPWALAAFLTPFGIACWWMLVVGPRPPVEYPGHRAQLRAGSSRPLRASYVFGALQMLLLSRDLRHILWPIWIAVGLVGGLYWLLGAWVARRVVPHARFLHVMVIGGTVVAGMAWLRAHMPEICYPHGQPVYAFYAWPAFLNPVHSGTEAFGNLLVGMVGVLLACAWWKWKLGLQLIDPRMRVFAGAFFFIAMFWPANRGNYSDALPRSVRVAAVQPNFDSWVMHGGLDAARRNFEERLFAPTAELLESDDPPLLIVWPENSWLGYATEAADGRITLDGSSRLRHRASATRIVVGTVLRTEDRGSFPAAIVVDSTGQVVGHQEKQELVPGGEFLPFVRLLPDSARDWLASVFLSALGEAPSFEPGGPADLPRVEVLSETEDGKALTPPFGALLCYDNAFPGPALQAAAAQASFLVVASNESWYLGGGELDQMVAMTVMRAVETERSILRGTTNGLTMAIGSTGRVLGSLPRGGPKTAGSADNSRPISEDSAAVLTVDLPLSSARVVPLPWIRVALVIWFAILLLLAFICPTPRPRRRAG